MAVVMRTALAIVAALAAAFVLVVAVELLSTIVHPTPPDFTGTQEEMCDHVARYPQWVLAAVVVAWSGTAWIGVWIATRLGGRTAALVVGLFLLAMVCFNVAMLPYPTWFKLAMPVCLAAGCWYGLHVAMRDQRRAPAAQGQL
ncbi:MAG TPA: hypothetical protein VGN12_07295 [Pirellulales bacterium]|jgi:hypothetical protein